MVQYRPVPLEDAGLMAGSAWTNQLTNLIILVAGSGFSGFFTYSPSPGAGNLIQSLAGSAGTDPYGNPYPQGFASYSSSGTTVINGGAIFTYNSNPPAAGRLVSSDAPAAGTDPYGNSYQSGLTSYNGSTSWVSVETGQVLFSDGGVVASVGDSMRVQTGGTDVATIVLNGNTGSIGLDASSITAEGNNVLLLFGGALPLGYPLNPATVTLAQLADFCNSLVSGLQSQTILT
jgi:hypothetical protein